MFAYGVFLQITDKVNNGKLEMNDNLSLSIVKINHERWLFIQNANEGVLASTDDIYDVYKLLTSLDTIAIVQQIIYNDVQKCVIAFDIPETFKELEAIVGEIPYEVRLDHDHKVRIRLV
jgi:hypothetical protein